VYTRSGQIPPCPTRSLLQRMSYVVKEL